MKHKVFWLALLVLMILHHDWWFWNDPRLLFGFIPAGLTYHVFISLAAGGLWAWAAFYALPEYFEDDGPEDVDPASPDSSAHPGAQQGAQQAAAHKANGE